MVKAYAGKEMQVALIEKGLLAKQLEKAGKKEKFLRVGSSLIEMDAIKTPKVLVVMTEDRMSPYVTLHPAMAENVNYMATLDEAQSEPALQKWLHQNAKELPKSAPDTVVELDSNPWEGGPLLKMLDLPEQKPIQRPRRNKARER